MLYRILYAVIDLRVNPYFIKQSKYTALLLLQFTFQYNDALTSYKTKPRVAINNGTTNGPKRYDDNVKVVYDDKVLLTSCTLRLSLRTVTITLPS